MLVSLQSLVLLAASGGNTFVSIVFSEGPFQCSNGLDAAVELYAWQPTTASATLFQEIFHASSSFIPLIISMVTLEVAMFAARP